MRCCCPKPFLELHRGSGVICVEYCKLQIGCLLVILYIAFNYFKERRRFRRRHRHSMFEGLLGLGMLCLFFDGLTAYTVNHLDTVNDIVNRLLHMFFLVSVDAVIFFLYIYMLSITGDFPKRKSRMVLLYSPFVINVILVVVNTPSLRYCEGTISNYSMGFSAYTCFIMAGIYILFSIVTFFRRWNYIESHKRVSIFTYLLVMTCVTGYQMLYPQALISSIATTVSILGVYLNQENPAMEQLSHYHNEMVMGFATLVENRDGSTGGHIRRTTTYVKLLAEELRSRGYYTDILTKEYMDNLITAAPMHDIGKISVPDAILQKPGRLTEEEFETMKLHASNGGEIIQKTLGHLGNEQYAKMAYQVARFHHEKWNGGGYPEGLKKEEIPLCARIMSIADVFDAVSEKRCYREAMPLNQCFDIIAEGSGESFEPLLAEVFLDIREQVELAHSGIESSIRQESA